MTSLRDVVLAFAAFVGAYVGYRGLNTWQRQVRGNIEYQAARITLNTVYELRDAISCVRNPLMLLRHEANIPEDSVRNLTPEESVRNLTPEEKAWNARVQEFQRRLEPVQKAIAKLDASILEAETLWGPEIRNKTASLRGLAVELIGNIEDYLEIFHPKNNQRVENDSINILRRKLYRTGKDDEFGRRLQETIREIEDQIRPHIAQKHW
ncbi:MAG: hypothetical protein WAS73_18225 [Defluviicoccus sp.]